MKKIRAILSCSTILPSLLASGVINVQSVVAAPVVPGAFEMAQAAPAQTEEEIRRKLEAEKLRQHPPAAVPPAAAAPHANTPPPAPAPIQPKPVPQAPPAPIHVTPVAPPATVVHPAPVPPPVVPAPAPHLAPVKPATPPPAPPAQPLNAPHPPAANQPPAHVASPPPAPANPQPAPSAPAPQPTIVHPVNPAPATPVAPVKPFTPPVATPPVAAPVQPQGVPHVVAPNQPPPAPAINVAPAKPGTPPSAPLVAPQPGLAPRPGVPNPVNQPSTMVPQFQQQPVQPGNQPRRGMTPLEAGAIGAAVGVVGGIIIGEHVRSLNEVQTSRQTVEQNGATFYSEPGRLIVREGNGLYVRHDETERFRDLGSPVRVEQRGNDFVQIADRPDGSKIITITDRDGQLLKRIRRLPNGAEFVLIDNSFRPRPQHFSDEVIVVPPPPADLPPDRYELDAGGAGEGRIYETLVAPPLASPPHRYTLDEVRYSRQLRQYMPSVDLNTITFETGSWTIEDSESGQLQGIADAITRAIRANPNEIFLVEGHTDAVGSDVDNLSLSDRRASTVASLLTRSFNVPPENLTTQGYGSQFLKVQTDGASRENRRVTVRRITPLLANGSQH